MNHNKFRDNVPRYLSRELNEKDLEEFETHYFNCLGCRDYLLLQKAIDSCIKNFIASADIKELEDLLDIEGALKEIRGTFEEEDKKSIFENLQNRISLLSKRFSLIKQIISLKSPLAFPFNAASLAATRGGEYQGKTYAIGETILLRIGVSKEGYVLVFAYDNRGNLRLVFPSKKGDNTNIKPGEEKRIPVRVAEPTGRQAFKAIFAGRELINPEKKELEGDADEMVTIEEILNAISSLGKDDWMEGEYSFDVIKG